MLFLLCSIPIVTIGPSFTALYHCTLRTVKNNNVGTVKTFFRAFKQNFVQSLIVWLVLLVSLIVLLLNIRFLLHMDTAASKPLFYLSAALLALWTIIFLYIFPVIAAFANTTKNLLKNALIFAFMHFPSTLLIAVVSILPMFMTYRDIKLLPLYTCCWFFFGFGLTAYVNSLMFYRMFKPYLPEDEDATGDAWEVKPASDDTIHIEDSSKDIDLPVK
ncbi:MAG: DUF624 domain-containing protein [Clostridia bacterium]|nr:DUF624 domain-containing protein [Clostridia bacterium]